jgi:hypothetical protein
MSESKHTPGPWYWDDGYRASEDRKTWSLIGSHGYGILSCDGEENSPQGLNDHANARLIAAAPELLDALRDMVSDHADLSEKTLSFARAAIEKATGA